jgi:hypothetical protein
VLFLVSALSPTGWSAAKYKILHDFGSKGDGAIPYGPLVLHGNKLYGVTIGGGNGCDGGCGTAYQLSPRADGTWKERVLYNFPFGSPSGGLVVNAGGDIYGTGSVADFTGGVFELSPSSGGYSFSVLYSGGDAGPGLLMDDLGNLYGEMGPGQDHGGAIGELSPGGDGWNYSQLYSFCNSYSCPDGVGPAAPPIWDGKGNMFGTTVAGGIYKGCWMWTEGCGTVSWSTLQRTAKARTAAWSWMRLAISTARRGSAGPINRGRFTSWPTPAVTGRRPSSTTSPIAPMAAWSKARWQWTRQATYTAQRLAAPAIAALPVA